MLNLWLLFFLSLCGKRWLLGVGSGRSWTLGPKNSIYRASWINPYLILQVQYSTVLVYILLCALLACTVYILSVPLGIGLLLLGSPMYSVSPGRPCTSCPWRQMPNPWNSCSTTVPTPSSRFEYHICCFHFHAVLWNRNYFLRFRYRFRLLKSYGSSSDFWQVKVPVPAPYLDHNKHIFQKSLKKSCLFTK